MKVDLHIHTVFSGDSTLTVNDLFKQAAKEKVAAVAITDHDGVKAIASARIVAEKAGICLVPGVEISCIYAGRPAHLLVFSDQVEKQSRITSFLDNELYASKRTSAKSRIEALAQAGLKVSMARYDEEVECNGRNGSPLVRLLKHMGIADNIEEYTEVMERYLPPEFEPDICGMPIEKTVSVAHACDAVAVLAHCRDGEIYGRASVEELDELRGFGIDGLEAFHPLHTEEDSKFIYDYACKYGLFVTGGSDFHGVEHCHPNASGRALGDPGLELPDVKLPPVIHLRDLLKRQG